jgi:hypothetical protein
VLSGFIADGITDEEHAVALGYLEGSMLLGLEDSGARMSRLGTGIATRNDITPVDEHIRRIRAVTTDDVAAVITRIFGGPRAVSAVGPLGSGNPALDRFVQR